MQAQFLPVKLSQNLKDSCYEVIESISIENRKSIIADNKIDAFKGTVLHKALFSVNVRLAIDLKNNNQHRSGT